MKFLTIRRIIFIGFGLMILLMVCLGAVGWLKTAQLHQSLAGGGGTPMFASVRGQVDSIQEWFAVISFMALLAGFCLALVVSRAVTRVVERQGEGLFEASEQVASASGQVASASQSLAEGASQQAASLEESSSVMEEMTSMVKRNADNTKEAKRLVEISRESMKISHRSLKKTVETMQLISSSSERAAKIIQSIDAVAFQTNLLALNAAVEAARAGEAGAGFAVVADEVRRLAIQTTDAAKNTEQIITETMEHVHTGETIIEQTMKEFYKMGDDAKAVTTLFGEISVASEEQAKGIEQINQGIHEMDRVVQQNAANAEESAAAAEQLQAQADQMRGMIRQLATMGEGNHTGRGGPRQKDSAEEYRIEPSRFA